MEGVELPLPSGGAYHHLSQVNNFTAIVYGLSDDFLTLLEAGLNLPFGGFRKALLQGHD